MRRRDRKIIVFAMADWEEGNFLGQEDSACLQESRYSKADVGYL